MVGNDCFYRVFFTVKVDGILILQAQDFSVISYDNI